MAKTKKEYIITKSCRLCNNPFDGREGELFCDDYCRELYNLHVQKDDSNNSPIDLINQILKRNRNILAELIEEGQKKTFSKKVLIAMDFNFLFHTHCSEDDNKHLTYCCYDYGYRYYKNNVEIHAIKNLPIGKV
jgi:hypothetical protein